MTERTVQAAEAVNANVRKLQDVSLNNTLESLGSVPSAVKQYIAVTERGDPGGLIHQTVLACTALPISISDDAAVAQYNLCRYGADGVRRTLARRNDDCEGCLPELRDRRQRSARRRDCNIHRHHHHHLDESGR